MKDNILRGFTLSEALIALTVVGIISALTVPTIVKNYQRHSYIVGLKKVYTDLQQNLTVFQTENYRNRGLYGSRLHLQDGGSISTTTGYFLRKYYKTNKDCGTTAQPCFAQQYSAINAGSNVNFSCVGYSVLLPSGAALCMYPATKSRMEKFSPDGNKIVEIKNPVTVYVDTNGVDKPNIGGRDMFMFHIYEDYSIDVVSPESIKNATAESDRNDLFAQNCLTSSIGEGCFGKILNNNWEMNY